MLHILYTYLLVFFLGLADTFQRISLEIIYKPHAFIFYSYRGDIMSITGDSRVSLAVHVGGRG